MNHITGNTNNKPLTRIDTIENRLTNYTNLSKAFVDFMQQRVQDFAYRAPLSWKVFAAGGVLTLIVSVATVSFHAARAALQNPVNSLRSER